MNGRLLLERALNAWSGRVWVSLPQSRQARLMGAKFRETGHR